MDGPLELLARRALDGDREALEAVIASVRDDVYHLARRMLGDADDAQDATQEILVRVMTHLASFRGESSLRTWIYKVASNQLLSMRRGKREIFSLEMMAGSIEQGIAADLPMPPGSDAAVLREEVMVGCTQGALLSLDRDQRMALTLCDLLDFSGDEAAAILAIEPATLRKRLQRARERLGEFMQEKCGLVNPTNACRCEKMVGPSVSQGLLDPGRLRYRAHEARLRRNDPVIEEHLAQLKTLDERVRAVLRSHPSSPLPDEAASHLRAIIDSGEFKMLV